MSVFKIYSNIINKKWLYFGLGVLITLLISVSITFIARSAKSVSLIKRTQTGDDKDPALIADGRGHIYGGLTTNQMNATSGLIVLGGERYGELVGRVGIGFGGGEIPCIYPPAEKISQPTRARYGQNILA